MDRDVETLAERLSAAGLTTLGIVHTPNLDRAYGIARGFDTYEMGRRGHRRADAAVRRALKLIDRHAQEPIFFFLHLLDPHASYSAPEPVRGRFTQEIETDLELPIADIERLRELYPKYSALDKEFVEAAYDEEVAFIDEQIGRFLDGMEERGLAEETLFILTSDHGEEFFEHNGFEHGHSMHQEVLRIPFMVWGSGIAPGRESTPISIADTAPTILEAFGLAAAGNGFGRSLWPTLTRNRPVEKDRLIMAAGTIYGADQRMALRWPFKLIQHPESGELQLFNLQHDPSEANDLSEIQSELAAELAAELDGHMLPTRTATQSDGVEMGDEMVEDLRELGYIE
jgi:arylsulfatase A-like enzyme